MVKYQKETPGALHSTTIELLRNRPRWLTLAQIAADTNLDASWLDQFGRGVIGDPSVNRVEVLRNYLISKLAVSA